MEMTGGAERAKKRNEGIGDGRPRRGKRGDKRKTGEEGVKDRGDGRSGKDERRGEKERRRDLGHVDETSEDLWQSSGLKLQNCNYGSS